MREDVDHDIMRIIEVRSYPSGWEVFEASGVETLFPGPDADKMALDYARSCMRSGAGEIRVVDATGETVEVIAFDGMDQTKVQEDTG